MNSKIRLYFSNELKSGNVSKLSKTQSHYIKNVMRVKNGEKISLFNSNNGEWDVTIISHDKGFTQFKVEKLSRSQNEESYVFTRMDTYLNVYVHM